MDTKDYLVIIQARNGSTRLPKKVTRAFYRKQTILEIIISNLKELGLHIIVATTTNKLDDEIVNTCKDNNVEFYRGSEDNVLSRFIDVIKNRKEKYVIRVCADNPFLDLSLVRELIQRKESDNKRAFDYISHCVNDTPAMQTHYGVFTELVSRRALERTFLMTKEKLYLEHVTNFIYLNPSIFDVSFIEKNDHFLPKNTRLTIDTLNDFEHGKKIYEDLILKNKHFNIHTIKSYLESNVWVLKSMKQEIIKNQKK